MNSYINAIILIILIVLFGVVFAAERDKATEFVSDKAYENVSEEYLSDIYHLIGSNPDSAFQLLQEFYPTIRNDNKLIFIKFQTIMATYFWNVGKLDTAAFIYRQNIDTASKYGIKEREINAISNLGAILNVMGQYDSAYYYLQKSLPLAIETKDSGKIAKIRFDLGNYYKRKGYLQLSLEELQKSQIYYEKNKESLIIVYIYNSLGNVYKELGDFDKSVSFYHKAIRIDSLRDDVFLLHDLFNNIGITHWKVNKNLDSARYYINKALDISIQFNSPIHKFTYLLNLGGIEIDDKKYHKALKLLKEAESIEIQYDDLYLKSGLYVNLGTAYQYLKDYKKSRFYYDKALVMAQSISSFDNLMNAYGGMMQLDSVLGDFTKALKHQRLSYNYRDSLNNQEVQKKVAELNIIHETVEKEKQNLLLQEQNQLQQLVIQKQKLINSILISGLVLLIAFSILLLYSRKKLKDAKRETELKNEEILDKNSLIEKNNLELKQQKVELEALNQTKDKFFTIIAHDLKNPFSSFIGLLDILETDFKEIDDDRKLNIISKLSESGRNTYNMLVNLLDWARSQRGQIEAKIDKLILYDQVRAAKVFLNQRINDKNHSVFIRISKDLNVLADKNLLITIIVNILNNAVKFTERGGEIVIEAEEDESTIVLSIKDNGIGMSEEILNGLFLISSKANSHGTERELGTGLGLILAHEFAQLMNTKIHATSELGKGSVFTLKIPKA